MFPFFYSDFEYKCLQIMRSHESLEENTNEKHVGFFWVGKIWNKVPPKNFDIIFLQL